MSKKALLTTLKNLTDVCTKSFSLVKPLPGLPGLTTKPSLARTLYKFDIVSGRYDVYVNGRLLAIGLVAEDLAELV